MLNEVSCTRHSVEIIIILIPKSVLGCVRSLSLRVINKTEHLFNGVMFNFDVAKMEMHFSGYSESLIRISVDNFFISFSCCGRVGI